MKIFQFTRPPDMTAEEAIRRLGIRPKPSDMLIEAVWIGPGTERELFKEQEPASHVRPNVDSGSNQDDTP